MEVRNPFRTKWSAVRYAIARPNVHVQVHDHMRRVLGNTVPCEVGLDIGCGTGHSTTSLAESASRVFAIDASEQMLRQAPAHARVSYIRAEAENLPFPENSIDLVTVGCTFHWCDPDRLFAETHRVLRPDSWLVIYDKGFIGPADAFTQYDTWHRESFLSRFPAPHRNAQFHPFMAAYTGFRVISSEYLQQAVPFSASELATYLATRSNVIAAVDGGSASVEEVDSWLLRELTALFRTRASHPDESCDFLFGGYVSCLKAVT